MERSPHIERWSRCGALVLCLVLAGASRARAWFDDAPAASIGARQPLWQPPTTSGDPIELAYLPQGVQAVVVWRAAEFMAQPEANRILVALGALGTWLAETLPSQTGVPLASCERITLGLMEADQGPPAMCIVLTAKERLDPRALNAIWKGREERIGARSIYVVGSKAYALAAADKGSILLVMPKVELQQALVQRASPILARELEELRAQSDAARHLTILSSPEYWTTSGKALFGNSATSVREWFDWFFGPSTRGALFSLHLQENVFGELRLAISADEPPPAAARGYHERLGQLAGRASAQIGEQGTTNYDRAVLERFPRMMGVLDAHTRLAVERRHIILRAYLPAEAAHNLALGARLLVGEP